MYPTPFRAALPGAQKRGLAAEKYGMTGGIVEPVRQVKAFLD
jgi:hypothetical protein